MYVSSRSEDSRRGTDRKWRGGPSQGLCVAKHISHQQRPTARLSLYRLHHRREPSSSPSTASTARRSPSTPAFTRTKPAPAPALRLPAPGRPVWGALRGSLCQTSARSSRFSYLPCPRPRFPRFSFNHLPAHSAHLRLACPSPPQFVCSGPAILPRRHLLHTLPSGPSPPGRASLRCPPSRSRTHRLLAACLPPARADPTLRARFHIAGFISQIHLAHARQSLRPSTIIISSPIQQDGPCPSC